MLSNEFSLHNLQFGWLVFGERNKDRKIVGADYRDIKGLMTLKQKIPTNTMGISFIEIYEVYKEIDNKAKRIAMVQISTAVTGISTEWKNHYYERNGGTFSLFILNYKIVYMKNKNNQTGDNK